MLNFTRLGFPYTAREIKNLKTISYMSIRRFVVNHERKEDATMKKISVREVETLKTTASPYDCCCGA
jgi:hypothetical protein